MLFWLPQLRDLMRHSSIDVFEWSRSDVLLPRLSNGTRWLHLASPRSALSFNGWDLAHAVVKADFLQPGSLALPGLGFLLQMHHMLDFSSSTNLRLKPNAASNLADVTKSSSIGRLGQGFSLLFGHQRGLDYVGHLATDPAVQAHPLSRGGKVADFLFEDAAGDRTVLESKASVSLPDNFPSKVKGVLKKALSEQVEPWVQALTPGVSKGYVVYSCLREAGATTPSAITFVDPPKQYDDHPIDLPETWVKRQNYAAWLTAMGLGQSAEKLRNCVEDEPQIVTLITREIQDQVYAFVPLGISKHKAIFSMGINVVALEAIGSALRGDEEALAKSRIERGRTKADIAEAPYSIFPDGTFLGMVDRKRPWYPREFNL